MAETMVSIEEHHDGQEFKMNIDFRSFDDNDKHPTSSVVT